MPPYAGASQDLDSHYNDESFVTIPLESNKLIVDQSVMPDLESISFDCLDVNPLIEEPSATKMDKVLDFNPCSIKVGNPKSALFKTRICAETGECVHKYSKGGYTKEEVIGEDGKITKMYLSKSGLKKREDRQKHKESGYSTVMDELLEYFYAIEQRALEKENSEIAHQKKLERQAEVVRKAQKAAEEAEAIEDGKLANKAKKILKSTWKKTKKPFSKKVGDEGSWKSTVDTSSGNTYYYHTLTNETSWFKPKGFKESVEPIEMTEAKLLEV